MASDESNNKFSSNLKVPPLKIVLSSSHQNNAVVNMGTIDDNNQSKSNEKHDKTANDRELENEKELMDDEEEEEEEVDDEDAGGDSGAGNGSGRRIKKEAKSTSECSDHEESCGQRSDEAAGFSSSSSSTSSQSSERSSSTTPSPETESLASNSTIISAEDQQVKNKQQDQKDEHNNSASKQDRVSRYGVKVSSSDRSSANNSSGQSGKKSQDSNAEQGGSGGGGDASTPSSKEQTLNANQRITRSSQRAAQQSKTENTGDQPNGDDAFVSENQEKIYESSRKVKRRKGEPQEGDGGEGAQVAPEPTLILADIYPADYQLPSQNSFELYRDIRKRPHKKLMKLNYIQPRVPHGFKDYLLNGGPYLLDGNKLGVGLNGARLDNLNSGIGQARSNNTTNNTNSTNRVPLRMKLSNLHQKLSSYQPSHQRHTSYIIPKISEAPKGLSTGSPLHELFHDQERARHQMRMQHLKERERSILAAEQEILRAYNKAAIADVRQKLHLSACTYFYYQERYHYHDEQSGSNGNPHSNEATHSQDEDLKVFNKEVFLNHLQEIDDKWDKIKKDMLVRHKNESDSLHAVQSLEWEWKAKEIGACDVRVSLKIEPEFVPRVEVAALDY